MNKKQIILTIKTRIKNEQRKHGKRLPDQWQEIAAIKIYKTLEELNIIDVREVK
jgi:hypothetical protein